MGVAAPSLPQELALLWQSNEHVLVADTPTSRVYRLRCTDGATRIAKLLKPEGRHERTGMDFLAWRDGSGTVRLVDRVDDACLLEDAGTTDLRTWRLLHGEAEANDVIARVIRQMHAAANVPPPVSLVALARHFQPLFEQAERLPASDMHEMLRWTAGIAEGVLRAHGEMRPLHGDLHHENIIYGGFRGWLAIDPQGLMGHPAYDVANIFGNPNGAFADIVDPLRIKALVELFATVLATSRSIIFRFAIAHAGLSISWSLAGGRTLSKGSDASERLAFLKVARGLAEQAAFSS